MHSSILLCDREWKIDRILYSIPEQIFSEGAYLTDFLSDSGKLPDSSEFEDESHSLLSLRILDEPFERNVLVNTFPKYFLVSLVHLEKAEDFDSFLQTLIPLLSWAEEELQIPYQDDYYRIELMNNQLINNQRALMKSNQRLAQTLKEVREANSVIALLEQDELTTLYCASAFYQKAQQLIEKNKDTSYDILALDLKRFKLVNETFGRESGDKLLKALAFFLRGLEGAESGLFARASADTFYILIPHNLQFHETLHRELTLFFQTYPLPMQLHWKIGVYAIELQKEEIPIEQMCDRARLAISTADESTDTTIFFYNKALHDSLLLEQEILDTVHDALKNHEFLLYLQPKVEIATGKIIGAEALIRWNHSRLGWIRPDQFIPTLEKNGYIYEVDQFIWEETCRFLADRKKRGLRQIPIEISPVLRDLITVIFCY